MAVISGIQGYAEEYDRGMHDTEPALKLPAPKRKKADCCFFRRFRFPSLEKKLFRATFQKKSRS